MNGYTKYTTSKEKSKTFKLMGSYVGIPALKKSQRGIIARKYLEATQDFQLEQFSKQCKYIDLSPNRVIKVNGYGKTEYITL